MKKILSLLALAAVLCCTPAFAQTYGNLLSTSVTLSNTTVTVSDSSAAIFVGNTGAKRDGLVLFPILSGTNSGTSNVVFTAQVSVDTTSPTYTTTGPITWTVSANGTNQVAQYVFIPASNFVGVTWFKLDTVATDQTNTLTVSSVKYVLTSP